jgi:hypothetical protein
MKEAADSAVLAVCCILASKDEDDLFLRNVASLSPGYLALYPRRQNSSSTLMSSSHIFLSLIHVEGSCEHGDEPSGSLKCWEVPEWLNNWQLLRKGSVP